MYPRQGFLKHASICCENAQADLLMNFGSKRERLTVGIEHYIIRQNRKCKKQPSKRFQKTRVNAPSAAFVRLSDF